MHIVTQDDTFRPCEKCGLPALFNKEIRNHHISSLFTVFETDFCKNHSPLLDYTDSLAASFRCGGRMT